MVRVEVPAGVVPDVVIVRVELPDPDTDAGLNDPVAPVGRPVTPKFTLPVNPAIAEMVAVKVVVVVCLWMWLPLWLWFGCRFGFV